MTGSNLRSVRESLGIKGPFIAKKLGMTYNGYQLMERRETPVKLTYGQWMTLKNVLRLDDIQLGEYE